jgi:ABC-type lipoprotein export system ATPase subunit
MVGCESLYKKGIEIAQRSYFKKLKKNINNINYIIITMFSYQKIETEYTSEFVENLVLIVSMSNVGLSLIAYLCTCVCLSIVGYIESTYMSYVMTDPESVYYYLFIIGVTKSINPILEYISTIIYCRYIMTKLDKTSNEYYWNLVIDAHPEWLMNNKNIHTNIKKGICAITETFGNITPLVRPLFRFISSLIFIVSITSIGFICILIMPIIIYLGYCVTYQNHTKRKFITNKHINFINMANDQAKNILNRVLNYKGQQTINNIIKTYNNEISELLEQRMQSEVSFLAMDLLLAIIQVSLVTIIVYYSNDIKLTPVIYMSIQTIKGSTWSLMTRLRIISERSSGWGPMEKCLKSYKTYTKKHNNLQLNIPVKYNEVQLFGTSGCGKTTFMRKTVIDIFINSYPGQYIYMDQHMQLIKTDRTILSVMSDDLAHPSHMNIQTLLLYSKMLQIDNIINDSTIHKSFNLPSGGEEKRIMILRTLLPLILDNHNIKVVFNDEITAGLDYKAWENTRILINIFKSRGIKFVTIDHHPMKDIEQVSPPLPTFENSQNELLKEIVYI